LKSYAKLEHENSRRLEKIRLGNAMQYSNKEKFMQFWITHCHSGGSNSPLLYVFSGLTSCMLHPFAWFC